jgi:D-3-phosphoglycerate dehydrogenase / 2-oxoglutarate reductase
MVVPVMRVVRSDLWIDPAFDEHFRERQGVILDVFPRQGPEDAVWPLLSRAHVYQCSAAKDELPRPWFVTEALLQRCPQLLLVSSTGAGYDTIDVAACTRAGVAVVNQTGGNAVSVAEHTFGLLLGVSRKMIECDRRMRRETGFGREQVMGHEIHGKTIGIVGIGNVGTRVAALARAFGMEVLATDPLVEPAEIARRGARPVAFNELLALSDVVSLHCPRDASTLGMMNADAFARMKPGAIFITTARGGIHDEQALEAALACGRLAGAGLDVWDKEPPPLDHPLLARDNVYATFHTAGVTHEARRNMARIAAAQVVQVLAGERPPRLVNPQVWPVFSERLAAARRAAQPAAA